MSHKGPSLCRTKDGLTIAKFCGKTFRFGRADDPESLVRFATFKARWEKNGRQLPNKRVGKGDALTIAQLVERYVEHIRHRYDSRWLQNNLARQEGALKVVQNIFGHEPAMDFSPKRLRAVRQSMIDGGKLVRLTINARVHIVRRAFEWAVEEELVTESLAHGLAAVKPLREGEYGSREGKTRGPVDEEAFRETLPYLSRPVAALLELMWWTGARPSELFQLRPCA